MSPRFTEPVRVLRARSLALVAYGEIGSSLIFALGIVAIYLVGVPWFSWNLAVYQKKAVPTGVLWKFASVYLPLDVLKAALLLPVIRVIRRRGGLLAGR